MKNVYGKVMFIILFFAARSVCASHQHDDLKDMESGIDKKLTNKQIAQGIKNSGFDVREDFLIKRLEIAKKKQDPVCQELISSMQIERKKINKPFKSASKMHIKLAQDESKEQDVQKDQKNEDDEDLELIFDQEHLNKFITGAINGEIEDNQKKVRKYLIGIAGLVISGGASVAMNLIQRYTSGCDA